MKIDSMHYSFIIATARGLRPRRLTIGSKEKSIYFIKHQSQIANATGHKIRSASTKLARILFYWKVDDKDAIKFACSSKLSCSLVEKA